MDLQNICHRGGQNARRQLHPQITKDSGGWQGGALRCQEIYLALVALTSSILDLFYS